MQDASIRKKIGNIRLIEGKFYRDWKDLNFENSMKIWFHAASVGEIGALKPLIKRFMEEGFEPVITVYTRSGVRHAGEAFPGITVRKYPFLDNPFFVRKWIKSHHPVALIIAETELWPFLIGTAKAAGLRVFIVNGRISDRTFRTYYSLRWFFSRILDRVDRIYAKSDKHRRRFILLGAGDVKFLGDLKVDSVMTPVKEISRYELGFSSDDNILTFGSIRSREIPHVLDAVRRLKGLVKMVIAPRHLKNAKTLMEELKQAGFSVSLRSKLEGPSDIVILDTMGELRSIYRISDMAFVGGTLENYGGHNVLEPLFFSIPTMVGKFHWNVKEQVDYFKRRKAIFIVEDSQELVETVRFILKNPTIRRYINEISRKYFSTYGNASGRIYRDILNYIE